MIYKTPNLRIVGGSEAIVYSWPSTAFIQLNFKRDEINNLTNQTIQVEYTGKCLGSLIDRQTVLTTSNCFPSGRRLKSKTSNATIFEIYPNNYYPSYESMMTIYLGLHDFSILDKNETDIFPAVKVSVSKLNRVKLLKFHFDKLLILINKNIIEFRI